MVLIIDHHLILIINFLLSEGSTDSINDSTGAAEKKLLLSLVKQRQSFAEIYITMAMKVTYM